MMIGLGVYKLSPIIFFTSDVKIQENNQQAPVSTINKIIQDDKEMVLEVEMKTENVIEEKELFTYCIVPEHIQQKMMNVSFKEESPVSMEQLRYVQVTYWGFDNQAHSGEMIIHEKLAEEVTLIFKELYQNHFSIEKMKLIDEYGASDERSMEDNNTSAYCCREITGKKGVFSNHSYGIAIDINPVQNPYIKGDIVLPEEGEMYVDRQKIEKGKIIKNDICYKAFISRGWMWGGDWSSPKDYQHFEKSIPLE
jgi:hypothetical protein